VLMMSEVVRMSANCLCRLLRLRAMMRLDLFLLDGGLLGAWRRRLGLGEVVLAMRYGSEVRVSASISCDVV